MNGHQVFIGVGSNRGDKKKIANRPWNYWPNDRDTGS
jgi:hypothetical protein